MENTIGIDFETYSEANLKTVGASRYAMDPSTNVLCLSYAFKNEEPICWNPSYSPPTDLFNAIKEGYLVRAWNIGFEYAIWNYVCIPKLNWPKVPFISWRDTQAQALTFALPMALDKCGDALGLDVTKDKRGKYLLQKLSVPQKLTRKNRLKQFTPESHPRLFEELYEYCNQDVRSERAIHHALPWDLIPNELTIWRLTLLKNNRGIPIDVKLVNSVVNKIDQYLEEVTGILPILTKGAINTIGQRDKIIAWCMVNGWKLNDLTADTVTNTLANPKIKDYPGVKALLEIRQLAGRSSIKKFKKLQDAICSDNRIHDCIKYHKSTTGRDGGQLFQPLNLPRATVENVSEAVRSFKHDSFEDTLGNYEDLIYTASALIRPSIRASKGRHLKVNDYSAIENCTVMWLAGEERALELIRDGLCLYSDMAADLYNVSYEQVRQEYKEDNDHKRRHGKITILGAIYGMGPKKFFKECHARGLLITMEEAIHTIKVFREKYSLVKDLWYGLEKAAIAACNNPNSIFSYNLIQFIHLHGYLFMVLPNGKMLAYPNAKVEEVLTPWGAWKDAVVHDGIDPHTKQWSRINITPGRYAENASQATAREVLMEATIDLERAGYNIILTVHDEVVTDDPEDFGSIEEMSKIMCNRSYYFDGLPLKVGGFIAERYRK